MDVFGGAPRFLSYPRTFTVPNGADAVLKCQIAGDPRPTVIWERDKTQISPHGRYRFLEDGNVYNLVVSRARVEDSGQYICKAKNSVGETYAAATLKVEECDGDPEDRPAFVVKPTSARVVRGHDVVFTGRLAGSPMPAVTWEKDGKKLTEIFESGHFSEGCDGEGWHHLKIFSARMPDAGVYLCKARNPLGEAMSAAVLLVEPGDTPHEPAPPTTASNGLGLSEGSGAQRIRREARRGKRHRLPHREPQSASGVARQSHATEDPPRACKVKVFSVTEGKHAKFRCYVTGKPKPEIFWRKDGRLVAPGRRHLLYEDREGYFILKVLYCKQQDNGLYACAASNAAGQTLSSVLLNVKEPLIKFKNQLQDVEVNEREQAILECEVPGDSIPAIWYLEDRKLHSSAKYIIEQQGAVHRLTIKDVTMDDDGVYLCEMKDGGRSIAEVAVKGKIVKRLPRKLDVVEGENAAFCVDLDEENVEVSWYKDGELLTESHKTIIKSFGKTHILVFVNVTVEDSGVITFVISDSKSSSQLRVKPRRHIPPSAPVNVRMSCEKPNVASLLWTSPPDCQRNGVTGYVIERQELGTEEWVRCLTTEGSTVVEILGESISNEARYRFRVCSVNNYGKSEQVEFPGVVHLVPSARIRTHLSDMTLYQDTDAEFTIELSTSVLGTWHMKGQQLHNDERFKIDQSRTRHMLLIRGVKVEENESEITFVAHGVRDSAILFVKAVPVKITLGPGMETVQQITASESIVLCCEVSRPNTKVQWCKDGEILSPSDRVSVHSSGHVRKLIVQSARPSDSGQYVCDATEDSLMFTVNVLESPVRIVNTTDDTKMEYLTSECIVLTCELSRSSAEVKWYKNGLEIERSGKVKMESHGVHRSLIIEKAGTEDSGEYVCDAGDDSIFYDITVREPPVRIVNSSSSLLNVLTGGEIVLSCEVSQPKAEVTWYKDGVEVEQSERSTMEVDRGYRKLTICPAALGDQGTYMCKAVDISAKFEVTVSDPPVRIVDSTSPTLNVLTGSELVLLCEVSQPEAEVRWYKDGVEVEHSERAMMEVDGRCRRLTIHPATMGDQGTYVCDAVDVSAKFEVTVSEPPVRIITSSSPVLSVLTGSKIFLSCELSQPQGEVRWHKDGVEVEQSERSTMEVNGTCRRLTICPVVMDDQGIYVCDAVDDLAKFEVTVSEPPVRIINSSSPVLSVLTGAEVVLTCELSRPKAEVKWYKDGVEVKQNENCRMEVDGRRRRLTIRQVTVGDGGIYLCDAIDDAAKFEVTVSEPPIRIMNHSSPVLSVLTGSEIVLSCELSRPEATVRWYKDGVEVAQTKRSTMEVDRGYRRLTIRQVTLGDRGMYLCDAIDDSAKFEVTVSEPPVRIVNSSSPVLSVLTGAEVVLSCELSRPKTEVRWYKDGVELKQNKNCTMEVNGRRRRLTIRQVTVGDGGIYLCDAVDDSVKFEVTVTVPPVRIINSSSPVLSVLTGAEVVLSCELSRPKAEVRWYKDGVELKRNKNCRMEVDGIRRRLTIRQVTVGDGGLYLCDAVDDLAKFEVTVTESPVRIISSSSPVLSVLTGNEVVLSCELSRPKVEVRWYKDGVEMERNEKCTMEVDGRRRRLTIQQVTVGDQGTYVCDAVDDSAKFEVAVSEPPVRIMNSSTPVLSVLTGSEVVLLCELSQPNAEVRWFKDGVKVERNEKCTMEMEGRHRRLTIRQVTLGDQGMYLCDAVDDSAKFEVTVSEPPVRIVNSSSPMLNVLTGAEVVMSCELSRPKAEVKWYKDGVEVKRNENCRMEVDGRRMRLTIRQVTEEDGGIYLCDAIDDSAKFEVFVSEPPVRIVNSSSPMLSVLTGAEVVLSCELSRPKAEVKWYKGGVEVKRNENCRMEMDGRRRRLTIRQVTEEDGGIYLCDAIDDSAKFEVTVSEPPVRIVNSSSLVLNVLTGDEVALSCELSRPKVEVRWFKDGVEVEQNEKCTMEVDGRHRRLAIRQVTVGDRGTYLCDAVDDSVKFEMAVSDPPVRIVNSSSPVLSVLTGSQVVLSCELSQHNAEVRWFKDGVEVERNEKRTMEMDGNCRRLIIRQVTLADRGTYLCDTVDDSAKFEVTVSEPLIRIINSSSPVLNVLTGDEVVLSCELSQPKVEVRWFKDGVEVERNEKCTMEMDGRRRRLTIHQVTMGDRGTYLCDAVDDSAKFDVNVSEPPVRIVNSSSPVLSVLTGAEVVLSCELSQPKAEVRWYKDAVEVKRSENCTLEVDGRRRRLIIHQVTVGDRGTYLCDAVDDSAKFEVTVSEPPVRIVNSSSPVLSVLTGTEVVLSCELSQPKAEVRWYKDGVEVKWNENCTMEVDGRCRRLTIRQVTVGDGGIYQCDAVDDSATFEVTVSEPPIRIVNSSSPILNVLTGDEVVLSCELSWPKAKVRWFHDGVKVMQNEKCTIEMDGRCRRLTIHQVTLGDRGTYLCEAVDDLAKFELNVSEPPVRIVNSSPPMLSVLTGGKVVLSCELSRPKAEVRWYKDGVEVEQSERSTMAVDGGHRRLTIHPVTMGDRGTYLCDAVDDLAKFEVTVSELPLKIIRRSKGPAEHKYLISEDFTLQCELSRSDGVAKWYKDGEKVVENKRISIRKEGMFQSLRVLDADTTDAGEYLCDVQSDSIVFRVCVEEPPIKIIRQTEGPTEHKYLTSEVITLQCELSRLDGVAKWYKDGEKMVENERIFIGNEGAFRSLRVLDARTTDSGEYLCDVQSDSVVFGVCVQEPPVKIIRQTVGPAEHKYLTSENIMLQCELSRLDGVAKWYKDGEKVVENERISIEREGTFRSLRVLDAQTTDSGEYLCDVQSDRIVFRVRVEEPLVKIIRQFACPAKQKYLTSEDFVLQCELSRPDVVAKWYKNGEKVVENERISLRMEGTFRSLQVLEAQVTDSGEYLCDVQSDSIVFRVHVEEPPVKIVRQNKDPAEYKYLTSEDITLQCELSWPDGIAKWYKDRAKVVENERISMGREGTFRSLQILDARTTDSGEYLCDVQSDSIVFRVRVEDPPVMIVGSSHISEDRSFIESETIAMTCKLSHPDVQVRWYKDGIELRPSDKIRIESRGLIRELMIFDSEPSDSGQYVCDADSDKLTFKVTVTEAPVLFTNKEKHPEEVYANENGQAVLAAIVSKEPASVTWYRHKEQVTKGEKYEMKNESRVHSLIIKNVLKNDSGFYICRSTDDEMIFNVNMTELPLIFVLKLEDVCVQRDGSITLWCELNKVKGDVMWLKNGKEVRPSRKHVIRAEGRLRSLTLCKATLDDEGEYSCESKDDRTVGRVSVRVPRVVEFISDLRSITVLEGDDAKFKCMVSPEDVRLSWQVHGSEVPPGSTKYVTSRNGLCHMLLIQDCQLSDIGQVIAEAEGIVSTANLQVQETQVVFTRKLVSVVTEERQDATFEVEVSNESAEVQWMKQGVVIQSSPKFILQQDGRTRRLIVCDTVFSDRGNYRCETLHDRTQAKLIIEPRRISVRKPLEDMEIFEKEAVTFQVELSHVDVDGMWIKDGIRVKPNNNRRISCTGKVHSLTLSALTLEDSGTVTFQADNVRSTSRITVREPPVTFLKELKDLRVPETTAITLECELSRPNVEVIWYKDDLEMKPNKNVRIYSMGRKRIAQLGKCGVQDSGTYSCDAGECKTSGKLEVFEQEIQIVKELEDQEVRENNNAVFVCEVSHAEVKSEWLQNGNRIKSNSNVKIRQEGTKHFLLIYKVRAEDAGEIRFRAKNAESAARLDVNELPVKIVKPLRDKTALEKHKVILECKVSKPHANVCWYRGGEELYASSKYEICSEDCYRQLVIHDVSFEDEATYTCDAFDDCSSAKVLVEEQAILIMKELVDMEVTAPNAIQLECEVSVPTIRAPQWSLNGQLLQNGDGVRIENRGTIQRLILSNTSPDMSGVVKFTAGKARCSAKLTVKGE
ncbi:obscurin-like isoform X2 [Chiloscyllium punctatum]|uniref:obscurin-like isoform X2 n=1 Tax=Chiloscyllium punctatum TaxID=137246 RepID=UPI003B63C422